MHKRFIASIPGLCSGFTVVLGIEIAVDVFRFPLFLSGGVMVIVGILVGLLVQRLIKKAQP
jgi:hypothetical protein